MATANNTTTGKSAQNNHDHTSLSFVRTEFKGPRRQRLTSWFNVPDEDYGVGNATGYRLAAEFMAWLQVSPETFDTGTCVREVMAAVVKALEEPFTPHQPNKRGAAVSFMAAMSGFIRFAAAKANHQEYLAGRVQLVEQWARESDEIEAERNRQTGQRLAAARKAKRAARMADGEVSHAR